MKTSLSLLAAAIAAFIAASLFAQQPAQPAAPAQPAPQPRAGAGAPQAGPAGQPAAGGRGAGGGAQAPGITLAWDDTIPAGNAEHATRALAESPRHGEWVQIKLKDGTNLRAWVTYPERAGRTGVVLVIHDINGMRDIPRAVGDQLAQDGFISIVPDFLSGKGANGGGTDAIAGSVNTAITSLTAAEVIERLDAALAYGKTLPSSNGKTAVTGFCWGGTQTFAYAAAQPDLQAAAPFYGQAPGTQTAGDAAAVEKALANVKAPVVGFYAELDGRIDMTIPVTEETMKKLGKSYEKNIYTGAGHGFMGNQAGAGMGGAPGSNLKAAQQAWPTVIAFFKKNLQ